MGFGTRLGGGCTSGHGLSGLGRLSKRSLVAVGCFSGLALATANILRHTGKINTLVKNLPINVANTVL